MILLIDNYDSFVHNLARYVRELGYIDCVKRNDAISLQEIEAMRPSHIILSPGPGNPNQAGITIDVINHFSGHIPILGVCLGHQAIGQAFGAKVIRAIRPVHGKSSIIHHQEDTVFKSIPSPMKAARYHSLIVDKENLPASLKIIATSAEGEIMGLQHCYNLTIGLQFHPESILTEHGHRLLDNFMKL